MIMVTKMNKTVSVLGTQYSIVEEEFADQGSDGYCDFSSKEIHIRNDNVNSLGDFEANMRKQLRHEIIHAFMAESGLQANWEHIQEWGHDETTVDWFAIQFPKLLEAFKTVDAL